MNEQEKIRYARHLILPEIGEEGQLKLKKAKVLVVGAGGLGCPVLQYLAAAGVGTIGLIDDDQIEASNLQRQVLYSHDDIGKYKAEVAKEKIEAQNPHIECRIYCDRLTAFNALKILADYDIIVDGSDNFATRYLVNDSCVILHKPFVFGSIYKFEGQVSVFNFMKGPTYRCLYPQPPSDREMPSCSETGVIGVLPGICGTLQANEVIKMITGAGNILSGKLLRFDALALEFNLFTIDVVEANRKISKLIDYEIFCHTIKEISAEELKQRIALNVSFQLIDVREQKEHAIKNIGGILIPLNELETNLHKISKEKEVIVHCQSGARSKQAASFLKQKGFENVYSLKNGLLDFP